MLSDEERAEIAAAHKNTYDQNMVSIMAPLFRSERIEWQVFQRRIIFHHCTLRVPVHTWAVGETLERVVLSLDDSGWHARLYKSKADKKTPVEVWIHATFGAVKYSPSPSSKEQEG